MYPQQWMGDKTSLLTSNHHHGHSKDFLSICCRGNVSEADTCQACHGEVQWSDVDGVLVRPALPLPWTACVKTVRSAHRLSQNVEPAVRAHNVGFFVNNLIITNAVPRKVSNQVSIKLCISNWQTTRLYLCLRQLWCEELKMCDTQILQPRSKCLGFSILFECSLLQW